MLSSHYFTINRTLATSKAKLINAVAAITTKNLLVLSDCYESIAFGSSSLMSSLWRISNTAHKLIVVSYEAVPSFLLDEWHTNSHRRHLLDVVVSSYAAVKAFLLIINGWWGILDINNKKF